MSEKIKQIRLYLFLHLLFMGYAVGAIFSKKAGMAEFLSKEYILNYIFFLMVLVVYAFFLATDSEKDVSYSCYGE